MNSIQKLARLSGVLYLVIMVAAIVAHMVMPSTIIVPGDAGATVANIRANATLFRLGGVGGELVVLLSEIVLAVLLYELLKPAGKTLSLIAAASRLVMTTVHGFNLINYYFVLLLTGESGVLASFSPAQVNDLVAMFLEAHSYGFTLGIAFLTLHVFILGYLILKSGYFPKVLGYLFLAAGLGYLIDSFALLLVPGYETTPIYLSLPITISEIAFPLWLLIKGVNKEKWQAQVDTATS